MICNILVAESLELPYLSAYLDSVGSNFSYGANFATAGSTIRPQNTTLRQSGFSPISLDVEWNEFYDFHWRSKFIRNDKGKMDTSLSFFCSPIAFHRYSHVTSNYMDYTHGLYVGGVYKKLLPEPKDFSSALYTFDIGQNDLVAAYFSNMTTNEVKSNVPDIINQFQNVVKVSVKNS